ncbi:MAG: hypothetical protein LAO79_21185, partial [Acidobacteriia bacterium]|nr:hypothetical protein [Terriglobia bacterium]
MAKFLKSSKALSDALKFHKVSIPKLSEATGVAQSTLWACKYGRRRINAQQAAAIAKHFAMEGARRSEFMAAVTNPAASEVVREKTLRERLASANASLSVDWLDYEPFSDGKNRFVDQFLGRFFQLSGVERARPRGFPAASMRDRREKLLAGETDIAVNLLCSLPRLKLLAFFLFPMRLSISAVIPARFAHRRNEVQDKLLGRRPAGNLRLIVADWEVGFDHATRVMGLSADVLTPIDDWDRSKLREAFEELAKTHADPDGPVPVVLADEIISLSILGRMKDRAALVFPLSTKRNLRSSESRREVPEYRLGLAIDRQARELADYLDEALKFYLLTDTELLATSYAKLFNDLTDFVKNAIQWQSADVLDRGGEPTELVRETLARDFARYALRLERDGVESYHDQYLPWRNILRRALQLVYQNQARDRLRIRRHVEALLHDTIGRGESPRALSDSQWSLIVPALEQEFDLDLGSEANPKTLEGIVSRVQTVMLRTSDGATSEVTVIPAREVHEAVVAELFQSFADEMTRRKTPIDELPREPKPESPVLLAVLHGQFIGCVQVERLDQNTAR